MRFWGRAEKVSLAVESLRWSRNDFCRGWYISGTTGSGKTEALKLLVHLLCRSEPKWGGLLIDEKGFFAEEVVPILRSFGRGADVFELRTRPEHAGKDWKPPFEFNLLGDDRVRTSQYVDAILMVAEAKADAKDDKGFFRMQAGLHIGAAIDLFRGLREWQQQLGEPAESWVAPTLRGIYQILTSEEKFEELITVRTGLFRGFASSASVDTESPSAPLEPGRRLLPDFRGVEPALLLQALEHFSKRYWGVRAPEQLEGIKGTIANYLRWFTDDAIHEVFGVERANFTMDCMERGKLICVSLPQRYAIERRYICALLKVLAYAQARSRTAESARENLMVIWQDEAQRFILPIDGDVDILRQFGVTTVIATQFRGQLEHALGGKEKANAILGNLRNRIILQAADEECAEESAKFIGKSLRRKRSLTRGADGRSSHSYADEVAYLIEPYQLRKLPKFSAVFCHASGRHRVLRFTPLDEQGKIPEWFDRFASFTLAIRLKVLGRSNGPIFRGYRLPTKTGVH
jgi:type IV secretory system conjugative DNA transfer VirD4/TraG family protein